MPVNDLTTLTMLDELNKKLVQAYEVIELCDIVVFEWTLDSALAAKFVTDNISQFGYTPEDFYTGELMDYWNFVYLEDREPTRNRVYEHRLANDRLESNQYKHEYRVVCKNGDIRWVQEVVILDYEDHKPTRERGILMDITESKLLDTAVKSSEERYRTLFDRAPAIMMTMDANGNITSANRYCQDFLGYDEIVLKKMRFCHLISHSDLQDCTFDDLERMAEKLDGVTFEVNVKTRDLRNHVIQATLDEQVFDNGFKEYQLVGQDVTNRKAIEERSKYLSYHDKLTGLYNRAWFDEQLALLDIGNKYPFTVIIGDMNGLKIANDLFGHKIGDMLLVAVAEVLRKSCRDSDTICRLGGDEFAVLLPGVEENVAREVCKRIREGCEETRIKPMSPSVALGYATKFDGGMSNEDLIKEADDRMYRNKLNVSKSLRSSLVMSLQASLEEKTLETKAHAERIQAVSMALGHELGLPESLMDELSLASMMHDIGKIGVPDSILLKPGKLTAEEWDIMKKHCEIGRNIVKTSTNMESVGSYILHHHERWDGTGYPSGLSASAIPLVSQIISVVDAFDVMCHNRSYTAAKPMEEAALELKRCSGTQFAPDIVDAFMALYETGKVAEIFARMETTAQIT